MKRNFINARAILLLIMFTLLLFPVSCGDKSGGDKDTPQRQEERPRDVPEEPIHPLPNAPTGPTPPATTTTTTTSPGPAPGPHKPHPPLPSPGPDEYVKFYKCYEGHPYGTLTHTRSICREGKSKVESYLFDCQGTNNCQRQFKLKKVVHGSGDNTMYCLENPEEQDIFSICEDDSIIRHQTKKGELVEFFGVVNGVSITLYCESSLPI